MDWRRSSVVRWQEAYRCATGALDNALSSMVRSSMSARLWLDWDVVAADLRVLLVIWRLAMINRLPVTLVSHLVMA